MAMEDLILVVDSGSSNFKRQVEGIGSAPYQSLTCVKAQSAFADSFSTAHSR
jgi:hypothetical protein